MMCFVIQLMVKHGLVTDEELDARVQVKMNKLKRWSTLVE